MSEEMEEIKIFARQHFVGLVDHKHLDVVGPQRLARYHV
jgi:hypothetical protein